MTLIAGLTDVHGGCCLFGDLMLTTRSISIPNTQYPTKPTKFSGENMAPIDTSVVSLVQKIELFTPNIVAGFAGDLDHILRYAQYLRETINGKNVNIQQMLSAVGDYSNLHGAEVPHMILFHVGVDNRTHCIHPKSVPIEVEDVGDLYVIGTGQSDFINFMNERAKDRFSSIIKTSTVPKDIPILVGPTLMLEFMDELMFYQTTTGWGVGNNWGGGCELFYRQPSGFVRMDNILFQSFICRNTSSGLEFRERSKMIQQYVNDELIIKVSHRVLQTTEIHIIKSLKRYEDAFHKVNYLDQEFDHPVFTMTNVKNTDTGRLYRIAQYRADGDSNVLYGDPKTGGWLSYNTDVLAAAMISRDKSSSL